MSPVNLQTPLADNFLLSSEKKITLPPKSFRPRVTMGGKCVGNIFITELYYAVKYNNHFWKKIKTGLTVN